MVAMVAMIDGCHDLHGFAHVFTIPDGAGFRNHSATKLDGFHLVMLWNKWGNCWDAKFSPTIQVGRWLVIPKRQNGMVFGDFWMMMFDFCAETPVQVALFVSCRNGGGVSPCYREFSSMFVSFEEDFPWNKPSIWDTPHLWIPAKKKKNDGFQFAQC